MSVALTSIVLDNGKTGSSIDIHGFISIKPERRWREYGTFAVRTYIITTKTEEIKMDMFKDIKEVE